jgi:FkbM family methyltransferase
MRASASNAAAGGTFIDIGANEGFFSSLAAKVVGPSGLVVAVEPQGQLGDVLEINLTLNGSGNFRIYNVAISEVGRGTVDISLTPISNTGATSAVRKYRWSRKTETVPTRTVDALMVENKRHPRQRCGGRLCRLQGKIGVIGLTELTAKAQSVAHPSARLVAKKLPIYGDQYRTWA